MKKKHQIEFLFPVAIFFFFTLSALIVILFAARIYQSTIEQANMNYNANTSIAYVREKIHQHDTAGAITLGTFDGCPALRMTEDIDGEAYVTYIYQYDDALREILLRADSENVASASAGMEIIAVTEFNIDLINDHLLYFSCTDADGDVASAYVGIYAHNH